MNLRRPKFSHADKNRHLICTPKNSTEPYIKPIILDSFTVFQLIQRYQLTIPYSVQFT